MRLEAKENEKVHQELKILQRHHLKDLIEAKFRAPKISITHYEERN
jgi:hypothetical protein